MRKAKGFNRRRRYACSVCLNTIMQYPGNVVGNGHDLVCDQCNAAREKKAVEAAKASGVECFIYATRNRPPMYGTVPEGWRTVSELQTEDTPYGTISYERKLTEAELYKWEIYPVSGNAFEFAIGSRVLCYEVDEGEVIEHRGRGHYLVRLDANTAMIFVRPPYIVQYYDQPAPAA